MEFVELYNQIAAQVSTWLTNLVNMSPRILFAVIVIALSIALGKVISCLTGKGVQKASRNVGLKRLFANTAFIVTFIAGIFFALSILNLDKTVTSLLAGVGIAGIALGFAFQDIAANYISGIIIAFQQPFKKGDLLETNGFFGKVQAIDLRATQMVTLDGLDVLIPNKDVLQQPLTNYTKTKDRRVAFSVGISYAEDLDKVKKVAIQAVKKARHRDKTKDIELFFDEFADSSINFLIRFWIDESTQLAYREAKSDAIIGIKKAFDKEGITIPFPIRTLDFGIKGGKTLSEMKLE